MGSDPVKLVIFIAVCAVLLLLGRMLSSSSEINTAQLPHPLPQPGNPNLAVAAGDDGTKPQLALTGAEIEFPIQIPPVTQLEDGTYNRPNILNYYFGKTDLVRGPADPDCLFDELHLEAQDEGTKFPLYYSYTVATLAGLRQVMDQERLSSLYLEGGVVIVPRWDLRLILHTVVDEIMKSYGSAPSEAQEGEEAAAEEPDK